LAFYFDAVAWLRIDAVHRFFQNYVKTPHGVELPRVVSDERNGVVLAVGVSSDAPAPKHANQFLALFWHPRDGYRLPVRIQVYLEHFQQAGFVFFLPSSARHSNALCSGSTLLGGASFRCFRFAAALTFAP
jgi:hypothetical protein